MKEVQFRVSCAYTAYVSKNVDQRNARLNEDGLSKILRFVEDEDGRLKLDKDSEPDFHEISGRLFTDLLYIEKKNASWGHGQMLIQNLANNTSARLGIFDLKSLKHAADYVQNQLPKGEFPNDLVGDLEKGFNLSANHTVSHPHVISQTGYGETSLCLLYGVKLDNGSIVSMSRATKLIFKTDDGHYWGMYNGSDNHFNYKDSFESYQQFARDLAAGIEDLERLKPLGGNWYVGHAVVCSKYKLLRDPRNKAEEGCINLGLEISSLEQLLHFNKYVQEQVPYFTWPNDLDRKSQPVLHNAESGAPIMHLFSKDDNKQPLLDQEPQEDQESSCCSELLKQVFSFS